MVEIVAPNQIVSQTLKTTQCLQSDGLHVIVFTREIAQLVHIYKDMHFKFQVSVSSVKTAENTIEIELVCSQCQYNQEFDCIVDVNINEVVTYSLDSHNLDYIESTLILLGCYTGEAAGIIEHAKEKEREEFLRFVSNPADKGKTTYEIANVVLNKEYENDQASHAMRTALARPNRHPQNLVNETLWETERIMTLINAGEPVAIEVTKAVLDFVTTHSKRLQ